MPTYVYECDAHNCHATFEANVAIADRDEIKDCPVCKTVDSVFRKIAFTGLTWAPTAGGMR